jgi:hypothetical protein
VVREGGEDKMYHKSQRICFWTTAVQNAMIYAYAEYYGVSRSRAVAMIVRRYFSATMAETTALGPQLKERYDLLMGSGRMGTASELASNEEDKRLDGPASDEVPWE